jgi:hypothetical protein
MGGPEQAKEPEERPQRPEGEAAEGGAPDPVATSDLESPAEAERSTAAASERLDELEERARRAAEEARRQG